uniref:Uncharacterized protein n=1 Tax=Sarcoptes scabiei TaxID=52283 RepID=A0A834VDE9_SARSC
MFQTSSKQIINLSFCLWLMHVIKVFTLDHHHSHSVHHRSHFLRNPRTCLERIWPDFQRCRDRQRDQQQYGRYSFGLFFISSDVYQPKYKMECCSYWDLIDCVHRAAKIYCSDDELDLKKLDKSLEMLALKVPLYICVEEYPRGSFRCKIRSWFIMALVLILSIILIMVIIFCLCFRRSK